MGDEAKEDQAGRRTRQDQAGWRMAQADHEAAGRIEEGRRNLMAIEKKSAFRNRDCGLVCEWRTGGTGAERIWLAKHDAREAFVSARQIKYRLL